MKKLTNCLSFFTVFSISFVFFITPQLSQTVESKIISVKIYNNFAYVKRVLNLDLKKGNHIVEIDNLPLSLIDKSISLEFNNKKENYSVKEVFVKTVNSKNEYNQKDKVENLRIIYDKTLRNIEELNSNIILLIDYEKKISETSPVPLNKKNKELALNSSFWFEFQKSYKELLSETSSEKLKLLEELDKKREELILISAKLQHFSNLESKGNKYISIKLETNSDSKISLHLNYLLPNANWYPSYSANVNIPQKKLELTNFALVKNNTGEDWNDVDISFSTVNPILDIDLPNLYDWKIGYSEPVRRSHSNKKDQSIYSRGAFDESSPSNNEDVEESEEITTLNDGVAEKKKEYSKSSSASRSKSTIGKTEMLPQESSVQSKFRNYIQSEESSYNKSTQLIQDNLKSGEINSLKLEEGINVFLDDYKSQITNFRSENYVESINNGQKALGQLSNLSEESKSELKEIEMFIEGNIQKASFLKSNHKLAFGIVEPSLSSDGFDYIFVTKGQQSITSDNSFVKVFLNSKEMNLENSFESSPLSGEKVYSIIYSENKDKIPLLSGPIDVYQNENYLSSTILETVSQEKPLKIEIGVEKDISIQRSSSRFKSKKGILNNKNSVSYDVIISIQNNKDSIQKIKVIDKIPYTVDNDVEIQFESVVENPSKKDNGILTYDLELKPREIKKIQFQYTIIYPSNSSIEKYDGNEQY